MQKEKHVKVQMSTIKDLEKVLEDMGEVEFAEKMRKAEEAYLERRKEFREYRISEQIVFENMDELNEFLKMSTEGQYAFLQKKSNG
jgi:hypothetical protein